MAKHPRIAIITHLTAILLSVAALALILIALLYNVPLTSTTHPYGDEADARWWLVRITEVDPSSRLTVPISIPTRPHYKPYTPPPPPPAYTHPYAKRADRTDYDHRHDRDTDYDVIYEDGMSTMTGRQTYGFGAWGWCEWRREDIWDKGSCVVKAFWRLPVDAPDDRVSSLELPRAIRISLSIAAFFIVLQSLLHLLRLIMLIVAWFDPPLKVQDRSDPYWPNSDTSTGTSYHRLLIQRWGFFLSVLFTLAWCLPVLIVASVGATKVNADYPGLQADLGMGVIGLCLAIFLHFLVCFLPLVGGLRVRPPKK